MTRVVNAITKPEDICLMSDVVMLQGLEVIREELLLQGVEPSTVEETVRVLFNTIFN